MSSRETNEREEQLIAYLYGELSPEENESVARRIAADAAWAEDWKTLQGTAGVLRRWEDVEAPVRHIVAGNTRGEEAPVSAPASSRARRASRPARAPWSRLAGWSVAAAAVLLLLTQTEVSRDQDGVAVRFGRTADDRAPVMTSSSSESPIGAQRGVSLVQPVSSNVSSYVSKDEFVQSQEELIRFLATLIRDSEDRQMARWTSAFGDYAQGFELQHDADLGAMNQRVGQMEQSAQTLIREIGARDGTKEDSGR